VQKESLFKGGRNGRKRKKSEKRQKKRGEGKERRRRKEKRKKKKEKRIETPCKCLIDAKGIAVQIQGTALDHNFW
jgi:hypothetical protein